MRYHVSMSSGNSLLAFSQGYQQYSVYGLCTTAVSSTRQIHLIYRQCIVVDKMSHYCQTDEDLQSNCCIVLRCFLILTFRQFDNGAFKLLPV